MISGKIIKRYLTFYLIKILGRVNMEKTFSFEAIASLCCLVKKLEQKTGTNFGKELTNLANNYKKTEIDAREFIKKNYPVKTKLTDQDLQEIDLLLDFYLYQVEYRENESEAVFCCCESGENPDEKPFRSRTLKNFISDPMKRSFVTGFFAKD